MIVECCACREPDVDDVQPFSDHDAQCKLAKFRCNQYECDWCDYCDAELNQNTQETLYGTGSSLSRAKSRISLPPTSSITRPGWSTSYKNWGKPDRPRPPAKEALDLSTLMDFEPLLQNSDT